MAPSGHKNNLLVTCGKRKTGKEKYKSREKCSVAKNNFVMIWNNVISLYKIWFLKLINLKSYNSTVPQTCAFIKIPYAYLPNINVNVADQGVFSFVCYCVKVFNHVDTCWPKVERIPSASWYTFPCFHQGFVSRQSSPELSTVRLHCFSTCIDFWLLTKWKTPWHYNEDTFHFVECYYLWL